MNISYKCVFRLKFLDFKNSNILLLLNNKNLLNLCNLKILLTFFTISEKLTLLQSFLIFIYIIVCNNYVMRNYSRRYLSQ